MWLRSFVICFVADLGGRWVSGWGAPTCASAAALLREVALALEGILDSIVILDMIRIFNCVLHVLDGSDRYDSI